MISNGLLKKMIQNEIEKQRYKMKLKNQMTQNEIEKLNDTRKLKENDEKNN